jgi:hypothetical protein
MAGFEGITMGGLMANKVSNADNRLYDRLIKLKTHLRSCKVCHAARKTSDPKMMCTFGMTLVLSVADSYDSIIGLRVSAHGSDKVTVFPCPKPSVHGKTFELTAIPVVVVGYQDRLL